MVGVEFLDCTAGSKLLGTLDGFDTELGTSFTGAFGADISSFVGTGFVVSVEVGLLVAVVVGVIFVVFGEVPVVTSDPVACFCLLPIKFLKKPGLGDVCSFGADSVSFGDIGDVLLVDVGDVVLVGVFASVGVDAFDGTTGSTLLGAVADVELDIGSDVISA